MHEALGSAPSTGKRKKKRKEGRTEGKKGGKSL
jgi:hypothetical protein